MNWRNYEQQTAEFFRRLSCDVELGVVIKGARTKHKIDVWVVFTRFGIETKWVVDCKFWAKPVTKEKVLVLAGVVQDVGADRGVLVSQRGFQAGAIRAAVHTNVTLTSLNELKQTARNDLVLSTLHTLETKAIALKYGLNELFDTERISRQSIRSRPLPGVDGRAVMGAIGKLSVLDFGFEHARLGRPPFLIEFDDSDQRITARTLEEFVDRASTIIARAEATLERNKPKINP